MKNNYAQLAEQFCNAIKTLSEKPENLSNFKSYLECHFPDWISKFASTPEDITFEMKSFAEMNI